MRAAKRKESGVTRETLTEITIALMQHAPAAVELHTRTYYCCECAKVGRSGTERSNPRLNLLWFRQLYQLPVHGLLLRSMKCWQTTIYKLACWQLTPMRTARLPARQRKRVAASPSNWVITTTLARFVELKVSRFVLQHRGAYLCDHHRDLVIGGHSGV